MYRRLYTPISKKGKPLHSKQLLRDKSQIYRRKDIQLNATKSDKTRNSTKSQKKLKRFS